MKLTIQSLGMAFVLSMWLVTTTAVQGGDRPVRNLNPELPIAPVAEERPLYYPRSLRDGSLVIEAPNEESREALLHRQINLHMAMRYQEALTASDRLMDLAPEHPLVLYNRACVLARLQRQSEAVTTLDGAIDAGWRNAHHAELDPDLQSIRSRPEFVRLLARMRELSEAERILAGPIREDAWQEVVADLEAAVPRLRERYRVPMISIALVRDGSLVWTSDFARQGEVRDRSETEQQTRYQTGGPESLITLVAAAILEREQRLELAELIELSQEPTNPIVVTERRRRPGITRHDLRSTPKEDAPLNLDSAIRWDRRELARLDRLIRAAVEIASQQEFAGVCDESIFKPANLIGSRFVRHDQPHPDPVTGVSYLGSSLHRPANRRDGSLVTTVTDLANLMTWLSLSDDDDDDEEVARIDGQVLDRLIMLGRSDPFGPDVALQTYGAGPDTCLQISRLDSGVGCLMRWYPNRGDGVVICFNSESGPEAVLRIARLALGGS